MKLKLVEKKLVDAQGRQGVMAQVVNAETGEPIEGLCGHGILSENGVRYLQVRTRVFLEEYGEAPTIAVAQSIPRINGR